MRLGFADAAVSLSKRGKAYAAVAADSQIENSRATRNV
jgi:hypothetical protein